MIGRTALEHIAARSGIELQTLRRTARVLREADKDYWPKGVQGSRSPGHIQAHHLTYLWCALMQGSVRQAASEAQELASARRIPMSSETGPIITNDRGMEITPADLDGAAWSFLVSWCSVLQKSTLLDAITWLIDAMADGVNPAIALLRREDLGLTAITRHGAGAPSVQIDFTYTSGTLPSIRGSLCTLGGDSYREPSANDWLRFVGKGISENRTCQEDLFLTLAECWADTKAKLADTESPSGSDPDGEASPPSPNEEDAQALEESRVKKLHPRSYRTALSRRPDRRAKGGVRATANSAWAVHARHERSHHAHRCEPA